MDPGQRQLVYEHGAEGVEEDLKGSEEGFSGYRVEKPCLVGCRKICVEAIHAQGLVVGQVVWSEGGRVWYSDWKVRYNG